MGGSDCVVGAIGDAENSLETIDKPKHNLHWIRHALKQTSAEPNVYGLTWLSGLSGTLSLPLKLVS